ncbi:hypothetical protein GC170_07895 [bacterium]|nr:hypothetical protein [bacterium]
MPRHALSGAQWDLIKGGLSFPCENWSAAGHDADAMAHLVDMTSQTSGRGADLSGKTGEILLD